MQIFGHSPLRNLKKQSPPPLKARPAEESSQVERFTATTDFENALDKEKAESLNLRNLSFLLASATPAVLGIANPASAAQVAQVAESKIDVNAEAPVNLTATETLEPGTLIVSDFHPPTNQPASPRDSIRDSTTAPSRLRKLASSPTTTSCIANLVPSSRPPRNWNN